MPSPSTCEKTVLAASATASGIPSVQVLRAATGGSGKAVTMHRLQRMPLAPRWRTASAAHIWIKVLPGERVPACSSAR
jgi:hypothetical protein